MARVILGIVGPQSGGKDTVADYLCEKHGFVNISTSDMVRDYIQKKETGDPDRDKMYIVANKIREKYGSNYLVTKALENKSNKVAITGIRAVGEAQEILNAGGGIVNVDSPIEIRYERARLRDRKGDDVSFKKFKTQEDAENNKDADDEQNILGVINMAKYNIDNSGSLEELYKKSNELMEKLEVK